MTSIGMKQYLQTAREGSHVGWSTLGGPAPMIISTPRIPGLGSDLQDTLDYLVKKLIRKQPRNLLRRRYYDYKQTASMIGLNLTSDLARLGTVLGWPAKAVNSMVRRTILDKWITPEGLDADTIGLTHIIESNQLETEVPASLTACLMHSCSFGFVSTGGIGEPDALISFASAENATAEWDARIRGPIASLTVTSWDSHGVPNEMALYVPGQVVVLKRDGRSWDVEVCEYDESLGLPVYPIPYQPLLGKPFGSSRISRPVMALTDSAVRTLTRTEIGAEFYNLPQRYVLGARPDAFKDNGQDIPGWLANLKSIWLLSRDKDSELPQVGQFSQASMEPNIAQFRMIAQTFAAETSLPLRSLGVVGDNPESADAITEANRELELEIKHWQTASLTPALRRMMGRALATVDSSRTPDEWARAVYPHWKRPDTVSLAAAADAVTKIDSVAPGFGASTVGLEMVGLEPDQIRRVQAEMRQTQGASAVDSLIGVGGYGSPAQ